jgi:hypothetical protein
MCEIRKEKGRVRERGEREREKIQREGKIEIVRKSKKTVTE